jgi:cell division protein FtsB
MTDLKIGIDAYNDLAKSHDAHVKEVESLSREVKKLKLKIKLLEDFWNQWTKG